jgi:hypothetical protein
MSRSGELLLARDYVERSKPMNSGMGVGHFSAPEEEELALKSLIH